MGKIDGKELLKNAKAKEKQMNESKKPKVNWTIVKSVVGTLLTLATIAGLVFAGWELRGNFEQSINQTVEQRTASIVSKANQ